MIIWSYIIHSSVGLKEDGLVLFCCGRVVGMLYDYGIQYGGSSTNHRGGRERDFRIFTRCSCYVVRTVRQWHDGSKALSKYNNFYDKYIHLSRLERGWRLSVDDHVKQTNVAWWVSDKWQEMCLKAWQTIQRYKWNQTNKLFEPNGGFHSYAGMRNKRKSEEMWNGRGTPHRSLGGRGATFFLLCVCLLLHSLTLCVGEPVDFCTNSCDYREDKSCDDGGPESDYQGCPLGTDCSDCGPRKIDLDQEKPKFHTFSGSDGLYKLQQK